MPPGSVKLKLRLVMDGSIVFGPGKAELLRRIAETGSISAAGRSMGMSYKKAWRLVDEMNHDFASPLVEAAKGGAAGGGARLTQHGETALDRYQLLEDRAAQHAAADLARLAELMSNRPRRSRDEAGPDGSAED